MIIKSLTKKVGFFLHFLMFLIIIDVWFLFMIVWMPFDRIHSEIFWDEEVQQVKETPIQIDKTRVEMREPETLRPEVLSSFRFSKSNPDIQSLKDITPYVMVGSPTLGYALMTYTNNHDKAVKDIRNSLASYTEETETDDENTEDNENGGDIHIDWDSDVNRPRISPREALQKNPTYVEFLSNLLLDHLSYENKNIEKRNNLIKRKSQNEGDDNNPENEEEKIPLLEEYLLENDSYDAYAAFLTSPQFYDKVLIPFFRIYWNNPKESDLVILKSEIRVAWNNKLRSDYYKTYNIISEDKLSDMDQIWRLINNNIHSTIKNFANWSDVTWKWLPKALDSIMDKILDNEFIKSKIWDEAFRLQFDSLLRNSILWFIWSNIDEDHPLKHTGNAEYDLRLRSYLYLYWKYSYSNHFKSGWWSLESYESDLEDILEAILYYEWDIDKVKENKYLKAEEARAKEQEALQRQSREETFRRNKEGNSGIRGLSLTRETKSLTENENNVDLNNASWSQIAQWLWLWSKITQFDKSTLTEMPESDRFFLNRTAFHETANKVFQNNDKLKSFIPIRDLKKFFNISNNWISFNEENWSKFREDWIKNNGNFDTETLDEIENLLKIWFIAEFNNTLKDLTLSCRDRMGDVHNIVKDHAIGAVIDNIKDVFDGLIRTNTSWEYFEWFKYDEAEPVKIDGDNMIISGRFRWEVLNISYNVKTWELKMSEYIHNIWDVKWNDFIIWNKSPTLSIWTIESFDKILENFYNSPTSSLSDWINEKFGRQRPSQSKEWSVWSNGKEWWKDDNKSRDKHRNNSSWIRWEAIRETKDHADRLRLQQICWTKIDEIWSRIKEELENHTTENSAVSWLLKTLNITPKYESVIFKKWSDLYNFVQIVQESAKKNKESLDSFLEQMPRFLEKLWLSWNGNNENWEKTATEDSKLIFDDNNSDWNDNSDWDDIIWFIRQNGNNFIKKRDEIISAQFEEPSNFWLLKIITEKFTTGSGSDKQFNKMKINEFMSQLTDALDIKRLGIA